MKYDLVLSQPLLAMPLLVLVLSQPVPTVSDMAPSPMPTQPPVSDMAPSPMPTQPPVSDMAPSPMPTQPPVSNMAPSPMPTLPPVSDMAPSPMPTQQPDCLKKCGDVDIPYPFGIGNSCAWSGLNEFNVTCNDSFYPPRPYTGSFEIMNISLLSGQMRVFAPVSRLCNTGNSANTNKNRIDWTFYFNGAHLISPGRNEFTAIGCNTLALLQGRNDGSYLSGCVTTCVNLDDAAHDGENCTGLGCCQTPSIPGNLSTITVYLSAYEDKPASRWSPCSHAFVAEQGWYKFSRKDLNGAGGMATDRQAAERGVPLVLDWAIINNGTCPPPPAQQIASACVSAHSECVSATQGLGYLCNCSHGYDGNPYVTGGCTNINECELRKSDPTTYEKLYPCPGGSTCRDTEGGYKCKCNFGRGGHSCWPILLLIVAIFCAVVALVVLLCFIRRQRKRQKQRGFFNKNGGEILKSMNINIFTKEQLDKVTMNYSKSIGNGTFGKVYRGTTDDNQQVAVKRSIAQGEERRPDDFVNEITIQFRINHMNLVRLVGCCLETDVPMLVFEFISNGSLYSVLHGLRKPTLSLQARLNIAIGSAEALSYMHSDSGHNIVHGDVKSGNILLDDNFMPKVSDFGSSKLVSVTRYKNWSVMGDLNYTDPVYIKTGNFTEKSDVYSFGVVILELITRKEAKYDGSNSLPINFVKSYKDGTRREMYDNDISSATQPHYMECLDRIGRIAVQCLKEDRDERPTMAHVVEELKQEKLRVSEAQVMGN